MTFNETWVFFPEQMTEEFRRLLRGMEGKVNDAPFRGFGAAEVRFLRTSKPVPVEGGFEMVLSFEVSPVLADCDIHPFGNLGIGE